MLSLPRLSSPRPLRTACLGAGLAAVLGLLGGCAGHVDPRAAFSAGPAQGSCLVHQKHAPTTPYEGGMTADSVLLLGFLRYYTEHGDQPFCDGKGPGGQDRKWGQLYVRLTGATSAVRSLQPAVG